MGTVLVTGGSSGIGLATVRRLAASGDRVFYGSRTAAPEEAFGGLDVTYVPLDLADPASGQAAVATVTERTGRLDALVNCAAAGGLAALEEAPDDEAHRIFEVNVFGTMRLIRAALPALRAPRPDGGGGGRIVNVTSLNDIAPAPFGGWYSASKSALMSLSVVLGAELTGTGVTVTVVAPGLFRTPMSESLPSQRAAPGSRFAGAFERLSAFSRQRLDGAGDPDDAARVIEDVLRSDSPPARVVAGADARAMEETVRAATPEDLARMLSESVATLTGGTPPTGTTPA
ncbi:MAG: SDR family NAD(P)-dependent oxidoreductase [Nocardiopsaceae bacterium]|nr:SDR family NAD(P)-dependent oxidoreductase [Nocardiopsaceae bacterium]